MGDVPQLFVVLPGTVKRLPEKNVRARFHQLAHRLEQEARRARRLASTEDFRVPGRHEWEAWETASTPSRKWRHPRPFTGNSRRMKMENNSDAVKESFVGRAEAGAKHRFFPGPRFLPPPAGWPLFF